MCGPGWWGAWMGGIWWIFPLVGLIVCLAFVFMAFRFLMTGRGCMCMSAHRSVGSQPGVAPDAGR